MTRQPTTPAQMQEAIDRQHCLSHLLQLGNLRQVAYMRNLKAKDFELFFRGSTPADGKRAQCLLRQPGNSAANHEPVEPWVY